MKLSLFIKTSSETGTRGVAQQNSFPQRPPVCVVASDPLCFCVGVLLFEDPQTVAGFQCSDVVADASTLPLCLGGLAFQGLQLIRQVGQIAYQ